MSTVIETNISIDNEGKEVDFQSRVINVDSWIKYIDEIKKAKCIIRAGTMYGNTIPRNSRVEELKYDNFHLSCYVYNYANMKTKKLCYLSKVDIDLKGES